MSLKKSFASCFESKMLRMAIFLKYLTCFLRTETSFLSWEMESCWFWVKSLKSPWLNWSSSKSRCQSKSSVVESLPIDRT